MKTYDLTDKEGRVFAFEVDNLFLRRGRVARILQQIPGCKILHKASLMDSLNCEGDEFLEFELEETDFIAWEPWGDNSRYWIGPKTDGDNEVVWCPQIEVVYNAFKQAK